MLGIRVPERLYAVEQEVGFRDLREPEGMIAETKLVGKFCGTKVPL